MISMNNGEIIWIDEDSRHETASYALGIRHCVGVQVLQVGMNAPRWMLLEGAVPGQCRWRIADESSSIYWNGSNYICVDNIAIDLVNSDAEKCRLE